MDIDLHDAPTYPAPDGSTIKVMSAVAGASFAHCALPAGGVSKPVRHRTVEEIWYVLSGQGELWRGSAAGEAVVDLRPGRSVTIPLGSSFQFRNGGPEPLTFVIATTPPWPGETEAVAADGPWTATV